MDVTLKPNAVRGLVGNQYRQSRIVR